MRILTVHNKYLTRGGEDGSRESEDRLLATRGHAVQCYVDDNRRVAEVGKAKTWLRTIWSPESFINIRARIRAFRPDIVKVHNFFPLISPAVYYAAKSEEVPVVQTLHNYRLICPNALLFRSGDVCESCIGKYLPWPSILYACYRNSHFGSTAVAAMIGLHRLIGTWQNSVDRYIVLTEFSRKNSFKWVFLVSECR